MPASTVSKTLRMPTLTTRVAARLWCVCMMSQTCWGLCCCPLPGWDRSRHQAGSRCCCGTQACPRRPEGNCSRAQRAQAGGSVALAARAWTLAEEQEPPAPVRGPLASRAGSAQTRHQSSCQGSRQLEPPPPPPVRAPPPPGLGAAGEGVGGGDAPCHGRSAGDDQHGRGPGRPERLAGPAHGDAPLSTSCGGRRADQGAAGRAEGGCDGRGRGGK
jgi:hypothetical protein